ncbi:MAG: hypothetical protein ACI4SS_05130, partial [Clostridia bacterium]
MKNTTKRTLAAMSAAAMLMTGGVISVYGEENAPQLISAPEIEASEETGAVIDHGCVVNRITIGVSDEENAVASEDGLTYLYKSGKTLVLSSDGSRKSFADITEGTVISYYVDGNSPMTL